MEYPGILMTTHCRGGYQPPARYHPINGTGSGEFVQITNISPFNKPLRNRSEAGG